MLYSNDATVYYVSCMVEWLRFTSFTGISGRRMYTIYERKLSWYEYWNTTIQKRYPNKLMRIYIRCNAFIV